MDPDELKEILRLHRMWLREEEGGSRADQVGTNLTGANLRHANLRHAKLYNVNLLGADLHCAILSDANLSRANLTGADLVRADLTDANLTDTDLTDADLTDANLHRADLTCADLTDAYLTDADLTCADLSGSRLHDAQLIRTNLTDTDLTDTDLTDADLTDADLHRANLTGANLTRADLTGADLSGSRLHDTNLTGADLTGADFRLIDLREVDLRSAKNLEKALLPADFASRTGIDLPDSTPREGIAPPTTDWETFPEFAKAHKHLMDRIDDPKNGPGTLRDRLTCLWLFAQTCNDQSRIGDQSQTARLMCKRGSQGVTHTGVRTRLESLSRKLGVDLTEPVHRPGCHEARRLTRPGVALREWLKLHPQYVS